MHATISTSCPDGAIDSTLDGIHSENATAFSPADLEAIRALIQSKPGGFEQLNSTVKQHLHRWFESQGAVRSGARVVRHYEKGKGGYGKKVMPSTEGAFPTTAGNFKFAADGSVIPTQYDLADGATTVTDAAVVTEYDTANASATVTDAVQATEYDTAAASVYEGDCNAEQSVCLNNVGVINPVRTSAECTRKQSLV
jgi:hypothetical protein